MLRFVEFPDTTDRARIAGRLGSGGGFLHGKCLFLILWLVSSLRRAFFLGGDRLRALAFAGKFLYLRESSKWKVGVSSHSGGGTPLW